MQWKISVYIPTAGNIVGEGQTQAEATFALKKKLVEMEVKAAEKASTFTAVVDSLGTCHV